MENPLKVSLENIIPLTEARDHFSQIVAEVQKDKLYVLTKGGKPAVAIVDVKYLEHITGGEVKETHVVEEIKKAPEKVGLPEMVEHPKPSEPMKSVTPPPPTPQAPPVHTEPKPTTPPAEPPQPSPFKPNPLPPPPPASKPTTTPTPPAQPSAGGPKPTDDSPLKMPPFEAKPSPQSNTPATTINVQVSPDTDELEEKNKSTSTALGDLNSPDDQAGPAQFAGDGADQKQDMPID